MPIPPWKLAEGLSEASWRGLARAPREIQTEPRERPENVKERIVKKRGYLNRKLESEQVAEIDYQPGKCQRPYRLIVLRKNLSVERGELALLDEVRYFFFITNRADLAWHQVVQQATASRLNPGSNLRRSFASPFGTDSFDSAFCFIGTNSPVSLLTGVRQIEATSRVLSHRLEFHLPRGSQSRGVRRS